MFIPAPLKAALEDSISSGKFIDTKFWVFDHLNRETGRLERPTTVFANSAVVRSVPYLSALLDEAPEGPLDTDFPQTTEEPFLGEYEYQSDTDLSNGIVQSSSPTPPPAPEQDQIVEGCRLSRSRLGRTVIIRDAAFVTFHAVLVYLYTREVKFKTPDGIDAWFNCSSDVSPPSAKSVYRLANKYGIHDLKELALLEIKSDIKECNIVEGSFGCFASWYPEIQKLYICRLTQAMRSSDSPDVSAAFNIKIQEYFAGKLPHARDMVLGLFDLLTSNGMSPHPSPTGPSNSTIMSYYGVNHRSWVQLRDAIIRSLTTGIFLDSMFYAEDSTELRPLFFCSSISPASFKKISEIGKLVPVDSLRGSSEWVIDSQDATSQKVLVVTSGDFRTWKSILLYIYTAKISFAPFGSSGLLPISSSSSNLGVSHEGVDVKLVYELATKIELNPLDDIACQNIKLGMTSENIVDEFLSTFSAEHEPIREMQYQLLRQEFWTADTQQGLRTKIEQSNDQTSHYGPAMAAVFDGLILGEQAEETAEVITPSSFHIEPDPLDRSINWIFQTFTAAPALRNMSQEEHRLIDYQKNPRTAPKVHPSNFRLNSPLSPTGACDSAL